MKKDPTAQNVKIYLFHLNNANNENGIKKTENWVLNMVDEAGKLAIEHDYYPTVSTKTAINRLQDFTADVLLELKKDYANIQVPEIVIDTVKNAEYLIAYCPQRVIR